MYAACVFVPNLTMYCRYKKVYNISKYTMETAETDTRDFRERNNFLVCS